MTGTMVILAAISLTPHSMSQSREISLDPSKLLPKNVKIEALTYKARKAVRVAAAGGDNVPDGERLAIVTGTGFQDGIIEVDLAGDVVSGAGPEIRGFTGVAFRIAPGDSKYEAFYVRTKNGRSEDQLQRNHSAQYISNPEFPWQRLRQETPGNYEVYVDLVPGEWTKLKIDVRGDKAQLYVQGAEQPTLIVTDLKHGVSKGAIALWVGPGTVAHFSNLKVTPR
jgi:Domain of Unknown Function (DUF1080)